MKKYSNVSIYISSKIQLKLLEKIFIFLAKQSKYPFEIILIDKKIIQAKINIIKKFEKILSIKYFTDKNISDKNEINSAINKSLGDIFTYINDDVFIPADWIQKILYFHNRYSKYAAIVGQVKSISSKSKFSIFIDLLNKSYINQTLFKKYNLLTLPSENVSIKNDVLNYYQFSRLAYPQTKIEHIEIGCRLLLKKQKIRYEPKIILFRNTKNVFFSFVKVSFFVFKIFYAHKAWEKFDIFSENDIKKLSYKKFKINKKILYKNLIKNMLPKNKLIYKWIYKLNTLIEKLGFLWRKRSNKIFSDFAGFVKKNFYSFFYSKLWLLFNRFYKNKIVFVVLFKLDWANIEGILPYIKNYSIYPGSSDVKKFLDNNHIKYSDFIGFPTYVVSAQYLTQKFRLLQFKDDLFSALKIKQIKQIHIYHGIVNKNIGYSYKYNSFYDLLLTPGNYQRKKIIESGIEKSKIKVVGYSKLDKYLFENEKINNINKKQLTILYAPTWGNISTINLMVEKLVELNSKYNLIVKPHTLTEYYMIALLKKLNIWVYNDPNISNLFNTFDIMITDSSSTMFEGLVTKKPIILLDMRRWITKGPSPNSEDGPETVFRDVFLRVDKIEDLDNMIEYAINNININKNNPKVNYVLQQLFDLKKIPAGERTANEIYKFMKKNG